jgi:hypothetical protein
MKLIKGEEFIRNAKSGNAANNDVMQTPAVLAVLADGYSVEEVLKAVETMKKNEGMFGIIDPTMKERGRERESAYLFAE